jgi:hypothetical protein
VRALAKSTAVQAGGPDDSKDVHLGPLRRVEHSPSARRQAPRVNRCPPLLTIAAIRIVGVHRAVSLRSFIQTVAIDRQDLTNSGWTESSSHM